MPTERLELGEPLVKDVTSYRLLTWIPSKVIRTVKRRIREANFHLPWAMRSECRKGICFAGCGPFQLHLCVHSRSMGPHTLGSAPTWFSILGDEQARLSFPILSEQQNYNFTVPALKISDRSKIIVHLSGFAHRGVESLRQSYPSPCGMSSFVSSRKVCTLATKNILNFDGIVQSAFQEP